MSDWPTEVVDEVDLLARSGVSFMPLMIRLHFFVSRPAMIESKTTFLISVFTPMSLPTPFAMSMSDPTGLWFLS